VGSSRHWIKSRHVWREAAGTFEPAAIAVEDDRIVGVERPDAIPAGAMVRDFGDRWVMPGLFNTHVHLDFSASKTPLRDFESEDPSERLLRAAKNANALLLSGVTTARDCGSQWETLALARRPDLSPVPLPRLLMSGPPITVPYGHLHFMHGIVRNDRDIYAHIARIRKDGGRSVKVMISGGQMTPGSRPEDTVFSQEDLNLVTGEARRLGSPLPP
jgi:imidazolonepropionase-like amidohydrolase